MQIIKDRAIVSDAWLHLTDDDALPADGDVSVSLARLKRDEAALRGRSGALGVRLTSDQHASDLAEQVSYLALICVEFPKFTDGRGYTIGRLLRDRYEYRGELRAVGQVLQDQLFYMARCGYDSFQLAPGKSLDKALSAFADFSVTYQAAADEPQPVFRRAAR